jgi:hypothetical protein
MLHKKNTIIAFCIIIALNCMIIKGSQAQNEASKQNITQKSDVYSDSIITKEVIIGVNWHLGTFEACTNSLFLSGNIFNDSLMQCPDKNKNYSYSLVFFDSLLSFSEMLNNGYMKFHYINTGYNCYYENILGTQNHNWTNYAITSNQVNVKRNSNVPDPFMDRIYPNIRQQHPNNYYHKVVLDTLSNYYRIPRSKDWDNQSVPYFRAISKVFYLVLFKCKLTYYVNCVVNIPIPNLFLDLSSPDPKQQSLCSFKTVPFPIIKNIEDIEPFNIH